MLFVKLYFEAPMPLLAVTRAEMYLPFCAAFSFKVLALAPEIAEQPVGTLVAAADTAFEQAYHLMVLVGVGEPAKLAVVSDRVLPTLAVPETLAALVSEVADAAEPVS